MIQIIMSDLIIGFAIINLLRIGIFLVATDWYDLSQALKHRKSISQDRKTYRPWVSVIIPAHNEEVCIIATVQSVLSNTYGYKQVIVVDDGSTDHTYALLRNFKRRTHAHNLKIVYQRNAGKAKAINNASRKHAKGSLIMVLDADSLLDNHALENMVQHFADNKVIASAANVKIIDDRRLIGLAQRIEYLISYRLKRALTVLNMEYIIGGVGSTFRKSVVKAVDFYDTDTIAEDIDFTLKLIVKNGNKNYRIHYAADVLAYTEPVMTYHALFRQRYRWKYGRLQSFWKHRILFLSKHAEYDKRLTWLNLPYAIMGELALLLEPLMFSFVLVSAYIYGDSKSLLSVYSIITIYVALNVLVDKTESLKNKIFLTIGIPIAYALMYMIALIELFALLKSIGDIPKLFTSSTKEGKWEHVERAGRLTEVLP